MYQKKLLVLASIMTALVSAPAQSADRDDVIIGAVIGGIIGYSVGRDDSERDRRREEDRRPSPPVRPVRVCESHIEVDRQGREYIQRNCWYEYR